MIMILNDENYFSKQADIVYCSASQLKDFFGCQGYVGCEAKAIAKIKGEWKEGIPIAFLVGSYVDAHFAGTLDEFRNNNPDIFTKKGDLKSEFQHAEKMIARCERDQYFMKTLSRGKQEIVTSDFFGIKWKGKLDSYHAGIAIVDLKTVKSIKEKVWNYDFTKKISFIEGYGYDFQLALYQRLIKEKTGVNLPCFIAAVSKENEPDIEVIGIDQETLNLALSHIETMAPRLIGLKKDEIKPIRCEQCDYCRYTKVLKSPKHYKFL